MPVVVDFVTEGRERRGDHLDEVKCRPLTVMNPMELIDEPFE